MTVNNAERADTRGFNTQVMTLDRVRPKLEAYLNPPNGVLRRFQFVDPATRKILPVREEETTTLQSFSREEGESLDVFLHFRRAESTANL